MFAKLLRKCDETDRDVIFCENVKPDDNLFGVVVNNGMANCVVFNSDRAARQFQNYCFGLGISTHRSQI